MCGRSRHIRHTAASAPQHLPYHSSTNTHTQQLYLIPAEMLNKTIEEARKDPKSLKQTNQISRKLT